MQKNRRIIFCVTLMFMLTGYLLYANDSDLKQYLEENEHIDINALIPDFHPAVSATGDEKIDSIKVEKVIKRKLDGSTDCIIAVLQCVKDEADVTGGFAVYVRSGEMWKLSQTESLGERIQYGSIRFVGLTQSNSEDMVIESGCGATGRFTAIYAVVHGKYLKVLEIMSNGNGLDIIKENGKYRVINFMESLVETPNNWQIYHEQEYRWDGVKLIPDADELGGLIEDFNNTYPGSENKLPDYYSDHFLKFERYAKRHPDSFAALYNCASLCYLLKDKKKAERYYKEIIKLPTNTTECPHCGKERANWIKTNKKNGIGTIQRLIEQL